MKLLLVEDNELIQFAHKTMLIELGCQVDVVSSGEDALSKLGNHYDLILLDIGLPGISGIEVASKFRLDKNHKRTKIIALTAQSYENLVEDCMSVGIDLVLKKPIRFPQLKILVDQSKINLHCQKIV